MTATSGLRRIVLTTHRRESFGEYMGESLAILRRFVDTHPDVALIFPVHPNPVVMATTARVLRQHPRIHLMEPLNYQEFVQLLSAAWLIVSDSGGVQEEAPTLGRPLIVLRENTERPEAVECGIAQLVGPVPGRLAPMLEEAYGSGSWVDRTARLTNPFGNGDAGARIVDIIGRFMVDATGSLATAH
jgi:UDP-N-acetylglucosamine 2-epimerase (non-hydrolysing)